MDDFGSTKETNNELTPEEHKEILEEIAKLWEDIDLAKSLPIDAREIVVQRAQKRLDVLVKKVDKAQKTKTTETSAPTNNQNKIPAPKEIKAALDKRVVGQNGAKKTLAVAVSNHFKRIALMESGTNDEIDKSNIILIGGTGSGKTLLARTLARGLKVPFAIADATSLTQAGYVGEDVESILSRLLADAGGDVNEAEKGIVYIDEIDKIAATRSDEGRRDLGKGTQQALLKLLEGTVATVPVAGSGTGPFAQKVQIDTKNILFICGGAFNGLENIVRARLGIKQKGEKTSIGFGRENEDMVPAVSSVFNQVTPDDFEEFGMIPELVGRLPVTTSLNPHDVESLVRILTEPEDAIIKQMQALFAVDGVKLTYTQEALQETAQLAIKKGTGARGLRSIVEATLQDLSFELSDMIENGASEIVITPEAVSGKGAPLISYEGAAKKKAVAAPAPAMG